MFSVSITHNSKIRKLSDGNRVTVCQTTFLSWVPPFLSYELWKLRIELWKLLNQTPPYLPSVLFLLIFFFFIFYLSLIYSLLFFSFLFFSFFLMRPPSILEYFSLKFFKSSDDTWDHQSCWFVQMEMNPSHYSYKPRTKSLLRWSPVWCLPQCLRYQSQYMEAFWK